jgi:hypothetical protein
MFETADRWPWREVVVWIGRDGVARWAEELTATPARSGPGRITAQVARDRFVPSLATSPGKNRNGCPKAALPHTGPTLNIEVAEVNILIRFTVGVYPGEVVRVVTPTALLLEAAEIVDGIHDDVVVIGAIAVQVALDGHEVILTPTRDVDAGVGTNAASR